MGLAVRLIVLFEFANFASPLKATIAASLGRKALSLGPFVIV